MSFLHGDLSVKNFLLSMITVLAINFSLSVFADESEFHNEIRTVFDIELAKRFSAKKIKKDDKLKVELKAGVSQVEALNFLRFFSIHNPTINSQNRLGIYHGEKCQPIVTGIEYFYDRQRTVLSVKTKKAKFDQSITVEDERRAWMFAKLSKVVLDEEKNLILLPLKTTNIYQVVDRLQDAFRELSLVTLYDQELMKVHLKSIEGVEFYVSFEISSAENQLVVKIQNHVGDTFTFNEYFRAISDVVKGKPNLDWTTYFNKKFIQLEKPETSDDFSEAVQLIDQLWQPEHLDRIEHGLSSLKVAIAPNRIESEIAKKLAELILVGEVAGEFQEQADSIREVLLSLIQIQRIPDFGEQRSSFVLVDRDNYEDSWSCMEEGEFVTPQQTTLINTGDENESSYMLESFRRLALSVLASATELLAEDSVIGEFLEYAASEKYEGKDLIKTLSADLAKSHSNPHAAYFAAKILRNLLTAMPSLKTSLNQDIVAKALVVGERSHAKLELQCKELRKIF